MWVLRCEKRVDVPRWLDGVIPLVAVAGALAFSGMLLLFLGVSPLEAYWAMLRGALGDWYGISETLVKAIPLALCGMGVTLAFRMKVWNIGAEGQFYLGCLATAAAVRYFPAENGLIMFLVMFAFAAFAGGLWGAIPGFLKARWSVNEIITTLMLNYVALHLADYFVYGPWRDPASLGFPMTPPFHEAARLSPYFDSRLHSGIFIALLAALALRFVFQWTKWGFEIRVVGQNPRGAHYAGIPYLRNLVLVMFLSGALAGLAGMCEIAGLQGRLQHGFSAGYGYTAIIVAWLARLNSLAVLLVSFLLGIILVGGDTLQIVLGLPLASTQIIQGLILFFVLGGEFFRYYKISLRRKEAE